MNKVITIASLLIALTVLESFWIQSIIETLTGNVVHVVACGLALLVVEMLMPKCLRGLPLLVIFVTQCYIWIV